MNPIGVHLFRSAAFRLAVLQAFLFAVVALMLFMVSWWAVRNYVDDQLRQTISDESGEVASLPASRRPAAVRKALAQIPRSPFDYSLFGRDGTLIAGDLVKAPNAGWSTIEQHAWRPGGGETVRRILMLTTVLNDGSLLAVGRDRAGADQLDALLEKAFSWAGIAAVLLALVGGMITAGSYLRRVETIAAAASRIAAGDLGARVSSSGRGDEFDRLALSLNSMLERIQTLVEGLRQVSSDIAHDLRTPLTHLRQRLEAATQEACSMESYGNACERALADVDGILETFAALLRITRIESRQRRAGFADVDLSHLLECLAGDYGPVLEDQGRSLHVQIADGLHVHGDAVLLTQMFVNILENALHHPPAGTPVRLTLKPVGTGCRVTVDDAGPGIPAHERTRVLGRFVRLDASRSSPGSGLGLALVAAVADLHDLVLTLGDAAPGLRVQLDFGADSVRSTAGTPPCSQHE
ncbi:MAG: sensor histidine kinase [Rhodanobacter sp.]